VRVLAGNDEVDAGNGSDRVAAGAGNDKVRGASGADRLVGGAGDDDVRGPRAATWSSATMVPTRSSATRRTPATS